MADIIIAGEVDEDFEDLGNIFSEANEPVERINQPINELNFLEALGDRRTGVIISRFHSGDLSSIKAMQSIKLKKEHLSFIFLSNVEIEVAILTLLFNEGAYGFIHEPIVKSSAKQLVKQAIKKSSNDLDESLKSYDLINMNNRLKAKIEEFERDLGRVNNLKEKLEKFIDFLLTDKNFKPSSIKMLIVTDSPYQSGLLVERFGTIGFVVKEDSSAENALKTIKNFEPNIVVSDLELGGMNGIELAKEVKGDKVYPHLYFVILTSSHDKADFILSPETMVDDCIIKPSDDEKYHGMIARIALGILTL